MVKLNSESNTFEIERVLSYFLHLCIISNLLIIQTYKKKTPETFIQNFPVF